MARKKIDYNLVKYIERHLEKGFHIKKVKRALSSAGHPIEAIEDAAEYVFNQKPHLRKKPKIGMIIYGIILFVLLIGFFYFVAVKTGDQLDYKKQVKELGKNQSYDALTDIQLLKLAQNGDMYACNFVGGHDERYACTGKYWLRDDCVFAYLLGEEDSCYANKAISSMNYTFCRRIINNTKREKCESDVFDSVVKNKKPKDCQQHPECLDKYLLTQVGSLTPSFCDNHISNVRAKNFCLFNMSKLKNDKSICLKMNDSRLMFDCRISFAKTFDETVNICKENYTAFMNSAKRVKEAEKIEYAKAHCFMDAMRIFVFEKGVNCKQIFKFISENKAKQTFLNKYSSIYKEIQNNPKSGKKAIDNFMGCEV